MVKILIIFYVFCITGIIFLALKGNNSCITYTFRISQKCGNGLLSLAELSRRYVNRHTKNHITNLIENISLNMRSGRFSLFYVVHMYLRIKKKKLLSKIISGLTKIEEWEENQLTKMIP